MYGNCYDNSCFAPQYNSCYGGCGGATNFIIPLVLFILISICFTGRCDRCSCGDRER